MTHFKYWLNLIVKSNVSSGEWVNMSGKERSVFNELKSYPNYSPVLIAFKLGVAPTQVQVAIKQLAARGVI